MKLLFYNHTGMVSGAERVMSMILGNLGHEFETVVACPEDSPMMSMVERMDVRTLGLRALEARFTWRPDRAVRYLISFAQVIRCARRLVVAEAPDIIHANSIRGGLVMSAATMGLRMPVIWHAHDILPRHPISTAVRLFASLTNRNRILAVSKAVSDQFRGVVLRPMRKRVPIQIIHNSVDLERFQANEKSRTEIRQTLGLGKNQRVVGIVGQLTPRKGQLELIKAFARASAQVENLVLLVIGAALFNRDEEYLQQLQREVTSLGISDGVRFLGARDDIPQLLAGIDLLVVNSHEEPFALTVLEGLSSGTPVLATSVGGTPEMIRHGETGWLVKARDVDALVAALVRLVPDENLRRQLGLNGREQAIARFSVERYMKEVEDLYNDLLDSGTPFEKSNSERKLSLASID